MPSPHRALALIAGLTVGALALSITPAIAAEDPPTADITCSTTAPTADRAQAVARACGDEVEVSGEDLTALPDGRMRLDLAPRLASDEPTTLPTYPPRGVDASGAAAESSVAGTSAFDPQTEKEWVGYCNPAEVGSDAYAETILGHCGEAPSSQRLTWEFDDLSALEGVRAEDIDAAEFIVAADLAWVDPDTCPPSTLELYADGDWSGQPASSMTYYAGACAENPAWTGYFDFTATSLAKQAVTDGALTVGLKAADESCMACGWNLIEAAGLSVYFNRAPDAPTELTAGGDWSSRDCTGERTWHNGRLRASAYLTDPDTNEDGRSDTLQAHFRVYPAGTADGTPLFEATTTGTQAGFEQTVALPSEILVDGQAYDIWVSAIDGESREGEAALCRVGYDITPPAVPEIIPVVGADTVYLAGGGPRGGPRVPGTFWVRSADATMLNFASGVNPICVAGAEVPARPYTTFDYVPGDYDPMLGGRVMACVYDRAGNRSTSTYEFDVASSSDGDLTPAAITVSGSSSYNYGSAFTSSVTVSSDAVTPYGTVTLTAGSTVLGSASFDARTKSITVPAKKLAVGTHTLTYTYRAFPGAPQWSTTRSVKVVGLFTAPTPTVSGTAQVGKKLTASRGTWSPSPSTATYVWKAGSTVLKSGTANWLTVPAAAKGKQITVTVTGSRTGYTTKSVTSAPTRTVLAGVFVAPRPKLTGVFRVGRTITASRGTWTPSPSAVKYVWKLNGRTYKTTTSSRLRLPASAKGKKVTVTVVGTRTGYTTKSVTSAAVLVRGAA
ncbi:Ig-like domain-containing protein [Nocardioides sp. CCNWLW239]|uniref:Ig-like domain-containing protein n=1 Tax=Nocardioides sp. CCNWLW239 TaxID=3128902 RepID=UPI00301A5432